MRYHVTSERTCCNPKITGVFCKENAECQAVKREAEEFDYVYFSLWNFSASVA